MVEYFPADFNIGSFSTFTEAMIAPEKNFFGKAMMNDEPLNDLQQVLISSGKARTAKAYDYFPPVIHQFIILLRKDIKENT